jgi:folate-binding protein YgfZ
MILEWKSFLEKAGAEFNETGVISFGNPRRELSVAITGNTFADLSHYGLISVHGEDAATFLQNQFTNDLRQVDEQHSQYSGYCNAKGRLLATFRIFRRGDSYYLFLPVEMIEAVMSRLRMYILRSKVTLEDASDTYVHLGVSGDQAEEDLRAVIGDLPAQLHEVIGTANHTVIRVPGIHSSYEVFVDTEHSAELWNALNVHCAPIGSDAWQLLDIQAGIPVIYPETTAAFVPQMANLSLVDGVSFKKGCYPGQEVVARMQYLGKLKRRMYRAHVQTDSQPRPGDELFASGDSAQAVGKLVSAAPHPDGGSSLLAVIQIASAEGNDTLHLLSSEGPEIKLEHLPYPFPEI